MTDEPVDRVFSALSDPTRRAVIRCLSEGGPATLGSLADELPVTRQAVAKHLAQLEDAGLVSASADGRRRTYRLTPGPLTDAMGWMVDVGGDWDERLGALKRHVEHR
ncbi:MAG TPA: metalloregulator ArsR/SmtB family transcription factor [Actinomycetota bacterium]|jgi:DNA-binding transcriptional ArsR family regulator